jgi:alkanesulfonate monooxygenase SsuD/methylene tetrahydromethanopterin reductase-like flavin-dependent oxidoreductase (luciferase family)
LGANFSNRGRRIEEQVSVLRELWTKPVVQFLGEWHRLEHVGIRPLPLQKPIPVWFGGYVDVVLQRVARMGDGWFPGFSDVEEAKPVLGRLASYIEAQGRQRQDVGIEVRIRYGDGDLDALGAEVEAWSELEITHLSINTMRCGFKNHDDHLRAIERFAELLPR